MLSKNSVRWVLVSVVLIALLATPQAALAGSATGSGYEDGTSCYSFEGGSMCYVLPSSSSPYGSYGSTAPYMAPHTPYTAPHVPYMAPYAPYGMATAGTYVVRWGDTMGIIARRFGVSLFSLIAVNRQIWNPNVIYVGQVLNLPAYSSQPSYPQYDPYGGPMYDYHRDQGYAHPTPVPANFYTVQRGDTLSGIARRFHTTVGVLLELNPSLMGHASRIYAGQQLRLW